MATDTTGQQTIDVVTPAAGESVSEGTILEWQVKVGDFIKLDDTIVEISTDKVDVELPSPASGTVTELLVEEGDTVTVGQVIARIAVGDGDGATGDGATGDGDPAARSDDAAPTSEPRAPGAAGDDGVKVSPVAARVAATEGVDLAGVSGSGPAGRITKSDVLAADGAGGTLADEKGAPSGDGANGAAAPAAAPRDETMKGGPAALARYMQKSLSIPTATSFSTLTVTMLDARRRELKAAGGRVSFTHLIAYAIVRAAQQMPVMADHFAEIDGKPHRLQDGQINLGLAVDVEKKDGSRTLIVPVITAAQSLPFDRFLAAYDALVEKARSNTLSPDDLVGANVTLTNPGGLGTAASVPRLMEGQGTIVATGSISYPAGLEGIGAMIGAEKVMTMTSTYDHRVIQGAESGRFLGLIEGLLHGEHSFYEDVFSALGVELGALPPPPAAAAAAAAARGARPATPAGEQLLQAVQAAATLSPASAATATSRLAWTLWALSPRATPGWTRSRWG